jgi:threonylcarbamoyladenosine tRNA methylthiotransferase MtaB
VAVVEMGWEPADIYVINTCAVTAKAAAESRRLIRRARRANPDARIVVTGCYAQVSGEEILEMDEQFVRLVGNANKDRLVEMALEPHPGEDKVRPTQVNLATTICDLPVRGFGSRTRAFLRVQDGCDNFCSYCIVPHARGRSRSLPLAKVLEQSRCFVDDGIKEQVVTGIHVGHYGLDLAEPLSLLDLLRHLAAQHLDTRYRISSLEPTEIGDALLRFMAKTDNIMPHLHIPLQSGDDTILQRMKRRYQGRDFAAIVEQCHLLLPAAAIGVDVLAGFPGEDEQAFERTFALLNRLPITYLHVFPYSRRPGTPAAAMTGQIPTRVKEERVARLRELGHIKKRAFYASHLGETHRVLVEGGDAKGGEMSGFTENYIPVSMIAPPETANQVVEVVLESLHEEGVRGSMK